MATQEMQDKALAIGRSRSALAFYKVVHALIRWILHPWLRARVRGKQHLSTPGPLIIAPVHRSNLDAPLLAGYSTRRYRALGKESLFANPIFGWIVSASGRIPGRSRGSRPRRPHSRAESARAGRGRDRLPRGHAAVRQRLWLTCSTDRRSWPRAQVPKSCRSVSQAPRPPCPVAAKASSEVRWWLSPENPWIRPTPEAGDSP